jgi:uncharacterized protein (DUF58 family)
MDIVKGTENHRTEDEDESPFSRGVNPAMSQDAPLSIGSFKFTLRELRNALLGAVVVFLALSLAIASSYAARRGMLLLTVIFTGLSLLLAALLAFTVVPALFRRARLEVLHYPFRVTKEGGGFLLVLLIVGLAAFNTNNNLLFIVFSATLASFVVSGILSLMNLSRLAATVHLPATVEALQEIPLSVQLQNSRRQLPAFSIFVDPVMTSGKKNSNSSGPVYFPYVPAHDSSRRQRTEVFPRRGLYRMTHLEAASAFPFGFIRRRKELTAGVEVIALPERESPEEFFETLPLLSGTVESSLRGEGADLYSIRDYAGGENARFIDWRATAKTGQLKIREFTREDERKCCFVFDSFFPDFRESRHRELFERAVRLCANAARHFHEMESEICLLIPGSKTHFSADSHGLAEVLKLLAVIEPGVEGKDFLGQVAAEGHFKILFTPRARGGIPTPIWSSAHVVFIREL